MSESDEVFVSAAARALAEGTPERVSVKVPETLQGDGGSEGEVRLFNYQRGDRNILGLGQVLWVPGALELIEREPGWQREVASRGVRLDTLPRKKFPRCNYQVLTLASLTPSQAIQLLAVQGLEDCEVFHQADIRKVEADLHYPLSRIVTVRIEPSILVLPGRGGRRWLDPSYVLWQLAQAYLRIYAEEAESPGRYGVYGHVLGDLVFEGLIAYAAADPGKPGYCDVLVGS